MTFERLELGEEGEDAAAEYLLKHGYRLIERNYRCDLGEMDIIAQDQETLCFVEVRTRSDDERGHPFESITPQKQHKLAQVATVYLMHKDLYNKIFCRFDVVAVQPKDDGGYQIELLQNAFEV